MRFATQALAAAAVVGVAAASSSAFTAGNTVAVNNAGQGALATTGFSVTAVDYTLGTNDAIARVAFNVAPTSGTEAATAVRVRLTASGNYFPCVIVGSGPGWSCDVAAGGYTAGSVSTLDVVAVS